MSMIAGLLMGLYLHVADNRTTEVQWSKAALIEGFKLNQHVTGSQTVWLFAVNCHNCEHLSQNTSFPFPLIGLSDSVMCFSHRLRPHACSKRFNRLFRNFMFSCNDLSFLPSLKYRQDLPHQTSVYSIQFISNFSGFLSLRFIL